MRRQQNSFWALPRPPQKNSKMTPKLSQNQKSEVTKTIERKIFTNTWVDPKTVLEPYQDPKNSPLGPEKLKNDPKIKSKPNVGIGRN